MCTFSLCVCTFSPHICTFFCRPGGGVFVQAQAGPGVRGGRGDPRTSRQGRNRGGLCGQQRDRGRRGLAVDAGDGGVSAAAGGAV